MARPGSVPHLILDHKEEEVNNLTDCPKDSNGKLTDAADQQSLWQRLKVVPVSCQTARNPDDEPKEVSRH